MVLQQLPQVFYNQLRRARVNILFQTLVDAQDVHELVRQIVFAPFPGLEGNGRPHCDGRDYQYGENGPLGAEGNAQSPQVLVRNVLQPLADFVREKLAVFLVK